MVCDNLMGWLADRGGEGEKGDECLYQGGGGGEEQQPWVLL